MRNRLVLALLILLSSMSISVLTSCKAKECPAYHEAQGTGGTIDKNKKRKKSKVRRGVFDKRTMKRYNR